MSSEKELEEEFFEELREAGQARDRTPLVEFDRYLESRKISVERFWRELMPSLASNEAWQIIVESIRDDYQANLELTPDLDPAYALVHKGTLKALRDVKERFGAIHKRVTGAEQWPTRTPKPPTPKRKTVKRKAKAGKRRSKRAT